MNYKRLIIPVLALVLQLSSCTGKPRDLSEDELYTLLNQVIRDDSLRFLRVCSETELTPMKDEWKAEFSEEDIKFISRQQKLFGQFRFRQGKLKWYRRYSKTPIDCQVDSNCNSGFIYHISFPLIAADRKKILVEITDDCNCMLGSSGGYYLYVLENGRWVQKKSYESWISHHSTNRPFFATMPTVTWKEILPHAD